MIHNSGHDAISIRRVKDSTYGVQIYDNEITRTRTNCGIRLEDVDDISIHGNTIGNSMTSGGSGYAGIMITNSVGTVSINNVNQMEIYDNFIYGKTVGIKLVADGDKSSDLYGAKIHNNRIYRIRDLGGNLHGGIWLLGPQYTHVESNTIDRSEDDGLVYEMASHHSGTGWKTYAKNNIISNTVDGHAIRNETSGAHTFDCKYNCLYHNAEDYRSASSTTDIHVDPLFVNNVTTSPDLVDLHLKSVAGRWNGSSWVTDSVQSPCIDAGDPSSSYSSEPSPNGGRINIGAYGNTAEASKTGTPNNPPVADAGSDQTVLDTDDSGSEQVTLNGSGSHDPDGTIVSWQWNFGDGQTGSGESVSHTYATGNSYTATLTVTDNDGAADSDTVEITVNKAHCQLTYVAGPNGSISGSTSQTVNYGSDGTEVTAVADTGYHFVNWSDGNYSASRTDTNVTEDLTITANFAVGEEISGLISKWMFDEGSGSVAHDSTGNNDISGVAVSWTTGIEGSSLFFNGDKSITAPNSATLMPDKITFSAWIKPLTNINSDSPLYSLFSKGSSTASNGVNFKFHNGGNLCLYIGNDGSGSLKFYYVLGAVTLDANTWYHVAATFGGAGTKPRVYLNGTMVAERSAAIDYDLAWDSSYGLTIGGYPSADWSFYGVIDEPAVYDRALTTEEISSLYLEHAPATPHSADTDSDWSISQAEVNTFISSYNNNNNTVATANGDITPGRITLREVLRVIYLYNGGGAYQGGQATIDTYDITGSASAGEDAIASPSLGGSTITVANSADSGVGSLRNAIANAAPGDTITFDESLDRITLVSEIVIDKSITIDGNGITIVSGNSATRVFQIHNENEDLFVSLLNMGIVDANNSIDELGGAIYNNGESLTLENCLLNNNANTAKNGKGGAVYTSGSLTIDNCVFTDNLAEEENDIYSTNDNVVIE